MAEPQLAVNEPDLVMVTFSFLLLYPVEVMMKQDPGFLAGIVDAAPALVTERGAGRLFDPLPITRRGKESQQRRSILVVHRKSIDEFICCFTSTMATSTVPVHVSPGELHVGFVQQPRGVFVREVRARSRLIEQVHCVNIPSPTSEWCNKEFKHCKTVEAYSLAPLTTDEAHLNQSREAVQEYS